METYQDFKEWLALLNAHDVNYVVVGAHALAFHGVPRFTGDMDILVQPSAENASRIMAALEDFGFGGLGITEDDFSKPDQVIQLGVAPVRIDIVTTITGISWDEAFGDCALGEYGMIPVRFLGRNTLVKNKKTLGRAKDIADIEALQNLQ